MIISESKQGYIYTYIYQYQSPKRGYIYINIRVQMGIYINIRVHTGIISISESKRGYISTSESKWGYTWYINIRVQTGMIFPTRVVLDSSMNHYVRVITASPGIHHYHPREGVFIFHPRGFYVCCFVTTYAFLYRG